MRSFVLVFVVITLLLSSFAHAQNATPQNLVRNGDFAQGTTGWRIAKGSDRIQLTSIEAQVGPYRHALRVTVQSKPEDKIEKLEADETAPAPIAITQQLQTSLVKGQPLTIKLWLRSPEGNQVRTFVQQTGSPWALSTYQVWTLTPQWQEYEIQGVSKDDFEAGEAAAGFHLSLAPGTVEIAGVRVFAPPYAPRPRLDLRLGHGNLVNSVAFSPDGALVASISNDGTLKL